MRFVAKLAIVTGLLVMVAMAQDTPTFHSQTQLVVVSAVVTDHSGAHVPNLKKEDFSVRENGAEQKIAVVEEIHSVAERLARATTTQPNVYSNLLSGSPGAHRMTIIAIDAINTPFMDQARARPEIIKFLSNWASSGEPMALVVLTRGGVKVIHDFTADPKVLAKALDRAKNRNEQVVDEPTGEAGPEEDATNAEEQQLLQALADARDRFVAFQRRVAATMTLDALQAIARAYGGIPGRKSLIWASSGFPFSISEQTISTAPASDGLGDMLPLYNATWQALNDSLIAVYPVDLRGLVTLTPDASIRKPSKNFNQQMSWANLDRIATFQTIAEATGGEAFYNTNDIAGAFRKAADDSSSYYLLGYYLDPKDTKPGWRKLKVTVDRPGMHVRARSGFFVQKTGSDGRSEEDVRKSAVSLAVSSPLDFTGIGLTAAFGPMTPGKKPGTKTVPFELALGPNSVDIDTSDKNHVRLDFLAFVRTATGETIDQNGRTIEAHLSPESVTKLQQGGTTYDNVLELPLGDYTVRFVVRDVLSGRMGTVSAPLKVE